MDSSWDNDYEYESGSEYSLTDSDSSSHDESSSSDDEIAPYRCEPEAEAPAAGEGEDEGGEVVDNQEERLGNNLWWVNFESPDTDVLMIGIAVARKMYYMGSNLFFHTGRIG